MRIISMLYSILDIGGQVGEPVREALRTEVGPALDAVIALEGSEYPGI